jgi:dUTP pyrophosphatase
MNNYSGKLIVLYGINNLGKSTQAKLLVEKLKANGYQAEYLKYPIYDLDPSGVMLNDYLRNSNPYNLHSREAQIIYAMNRTQYQSALRKKLKAGTIVIAEDYKGTGIAWGLGAGVEEKFLKEINSHLIDEDLVFLFDGERFRQAIENNHKHENNEDLTNKVRWAHLKLGEEFGWKKINANLSIEEISNKIWESTLELLAGPNENLERAKEVYNYSGFKTIGDIITDNHKSIFPIEDSGPIENIPVKNIIPEQIIPEQKIETEIKEEPNLLVEKLFPQAKLPQKAHEGDAGFDLYSNDYYSIAPYAHTLVSTGIKLAIPEGYVGLIWDKSGIAFEGMKTMGGVIDSNYRGEIRVIIKNLSEEVYNIIPGQKIAQILIQAVSGMEIKEQKIVDATEREANGFGSTGKF